METQNLVEEAKRLRDTGMSWTKVAKRINKMGFKTVTGLPWQDSNLTKQVLAVYPEYRSNAPRVFRKRRVLTTNTAKTSSNPNETAIDLILSTKSISIKDRLEIALKLL